MNPDGTGTTQLTSDSLGAVYPHCSPDGTHFVYASFRSIPDPIFPLGNYALMVKNADGGAKYNIFVLDVNSATLTQLTHTPGGTDLTAAWSPDGGRIAFVSDRDGDDEIYVMNADGSGQIRLTTSAGPDLWPAWSPDGLQIAFDSHRDGNIQIYVMHADGSGQTPITRDSWDDMMPSSAR